MRVLVIESYIEMQELMRLFLEFDGYETVGVSSVAEAIEVLSGEETYSLIVLGDSQSDIELKHLFLANAQSKIVQNIPILFCTDGVRSLKEINTYSEVIELLVPFSKKLFSQSVDRLIHSYNSFRLKVYHLVLCTALMFWETDNSLKFL